MAESSKDSSGNHTRTPSRLHRARFQAGATSATIVRMRLPLLLVLLAAPLAAQQTLPLWPSGTPEPAHTTTPEHDATKPSDVLIAGKILQHLTDVTVPTLTFYPAPDPNGTAVLVFPGGGYQIPRLRP